MPPRRPPAPANPPLSPGVRAAFWAAMLALPLLFFLALEGGLRLVGYGTHHPLFEPVEGHPEFLQQNREVARRYFRTLRDAPAPLHDVFLAEKPPDELRLVVQGGSTAAGFPFYHGAAFSRMLEARLQASLPDRPVEVVNTAMAAVNSFTLLDLAREIAAQRPDAVLIYAGHNEYYGALGVGSTERLVGSRALVNAYLRLQRLRTVQLVRDGLERLAGAAAPPRSGSLMARMVREQEIPLGSPAFARGEAQFRGNLSDLLAFYRRRGIPVFVATLVSNERDHAPFANAFRAGTDRAAWQAEVEAGRRALAAGDARAAIAALEAATRRDDLAAEAFFWLGRAYEAAGRPEDARRAYRDASDRDALRFRAPSSFNAIVREVAAAHGATVVDVEAYFRAAAPRGLIGREHMLEHLHPTVEGYALITDAFYDALLASPLLAGSGARRLTPEEGRRLARLTPADSLLGMIRLRQLMAGWPFAPPGAQPPDPAEGLDLTQPEARLALALYRNEKGWLEATAELAQTYEREGRVADAIRTHEAMVQAYPMLALTHLGLAATLVRAGDLDRAAAAYRAAIERGETSGTARGLLGAIELERGMRAARMGEHQRAREQFERARELLEGARAQNPRNPQTLYNLSGAYAQLGRFDEARRTVEALLRLQPEHPGGRQLLASLPE